MLISLLLFKKTITETITFNWWKNYQTCSLGCSWCVAVVVATNLQSEQCIIRLFSFGVLLTARKYIETSLPSSTWTQRKLGLWKDPIKCILISFLYYCLTKSFSSGWLVTVMWGLSHPCLSPSTAAVFLVGEEGYDALWRQHVSRVMRGFTQQGLSETPGTDWSTLPSLRHEATSIFPLPPKEIGVIARDCCLQTHLILST